MRGINGPHALGVDRQRQRKEKCACSDRRKVNYDKKLKEVVELSI